MRYHVRMKIKMSIKLTDLLKRELSYADLALNTLKSEMKGYEKEYSMTWKDFLNKFDSGELGDNREWFKWYGLAVSAKDWNDTKKEIAETIGTS